MRTYILPQLHLNLEEIRDHNLLHMSGEGCLRRELISQKLQVDTNAFTHRS